ncbi:MAG: hypothetical protein KGP35_03775, partial [Bacteroidetes bacterium]|nr:hypothetical protein [Bacteroidota bacterium]
MSLRLLVLILFTASASSIIGQTLSGSHWMKLKPEQDSILQLKEVLIRAPKNAWKKRKDTTTFNLERYRDGMEKSVEDILRKLPGIHIDAHSGSITYKGNTVQSVKLDGHDLLGQHYVAGTRNIAADLIQEVQAIEHDPEHPLLKGLESGGKTVLNLTLNKNLARLNGQINVAAGLRNDRQGVGEVQSSLLGLSGKLKSFITGGVNNRGVNKGIDNDYFSESMTEDRVERKDYTIPYLLQPLFIRLPLPDQAYRFNEEKNLHLNLLMPVGAKQLVRGNFHWTNDQIQQSNFQQARLFTKNDSWQISDRMEGKLRPSLFSAAMFWEIKIRPTTMFHYKGNVEQQQSLTEWLQQMNDRQQMSSIVISQNRSQQHQLEWITRFNEHT